MPMIFVKIKHKIIQGILLNRGLKIYVIKINYKKNWIKIGLN